MSRTFRNTTFGRHGKRYDKDGNITPIAPDGKHGWKCSCEWCSENKAHAKKDAASLSDLFEELGVRSSRRSKQARKIDKK